MNGQSVVAFVDASYCRKTGVSGWGMTVKLSPTEPALELGGEMDCYAGSHEPEQVAMLEGVAVLVNQVGVAGKHVVLYADTVPDDPYGLTTRLLASGALSARLEYQPAHRGAANSHAGLHETADRIAKGFMRQQRDFLLKG